MEKNIRKHQTELSAKMYNHIITWDVWWAKRFNDFFWWVDERFLTQELFEYIPKDKSLKILELPIWTGILTLDHYKLYSKSDIIGCDYSPMMLSLAKKKAESLGIDQISFLEGNVESLPFEDWAFDVVLSMNGLHVFKNKEKALQELIRVVKPGGLFLWCSYLEWWNNRTDWLVKNVYLKKGFFSLPFYCKSQFENILRKYCSEVMVKSYKAQWLFICKK